MDFFEAQDRARGQSHLLVAYFIMAVALIVVALYVAITAIWFVALEQGGDSGAGRGFAIWDPVRFGCVALATVAGIGLASIFKVMQMRRGGGVVARSLGGTQVKLSTRDFKEKQLLNVVEEMAIASGVPMPEVYLLEDELGINAFAAGFSPNDAAVAVTRGCLEQLSRDELQGVIAHEFSHILNGDMRLNIKLSGVLFGILILAITGRVILGSFRHTRVRGGGSSRGGGKGGGGIVIAILLTALALFVIGYIGVFFGKLIQAAVSRRREYLADAAAVQFTRNPHGIAGALKKIGGLAQGGRMQNGKAMNLAHMCFSSMDKRGTMFLSMATHPPLLERIRAIDPSFDGKFPALRATPEKPSGEPAGKREGPSGAAGGQALAASAGASGGRTPESAPGPAARRVPQERFRVGKAGVVGAVGRLDAERLDHTRRLLDAIPEPIRSAREDTIAARAVVLAMVFDRDPISLKRQLKAVREDAAPGVADAIDRLTPLVRELPPELRLPALEWVAPALYDLSAQEYRHFESVLQQCIVSDQRLDFREFILQRVVKHQVASRLRGREVDTGRIRFKSVAPLAPSFEIVLSFVLHRSAREAGEQRKLFRQALARMPEMRGIDLLPERKMNYHELHKALDQLGQAVFKIRKVFLEACVEAVAADEKITVEELETIRALALSLDCPMPPLKLGSAAAAEGEGVMS